MTGPGGRGGGRSGRAGRAAGKKAGQASTRERGTSQDGAADGGKMVGERSPRTPEQQRRAAERARTLRERRAAERAGRDAPAEPAGEDGSPGTPAAGRSRPSAQTARYRRRRLVAVLVVVVVLLVALAAAGWWALGRFGPPVSEIRVTGNRAVSTADVRTAAGVQPGTPLASVDDAGVRARVAAIPGVASVEVGRSWPDVLTVAVTERTPVALVEGPGGRRLVDRTGLAYRPAPQAPPRLPLLTLPRVGPDDPATVAAVQLLAALPAPVRDQVDAVVLGPGGTTLELNLTEGRRVLWGRWGPDADSAGKAAILGPLLSREGSVYDVSSPALPTVRR